MKDGSLFALNKTMKGRLAVNEILEDISVRNKTLSVLLPAEIDEHISSILRMELDRQISTKRIERIVFDFARTEWMDSSGLGMILGRYKKMQFVKGCMSIRGLPPLCGWPVYIK